MTDEARTDTPGPSLEEAAGPIGTDLAASMAERIAQTIDGFPADALAHAAIAALVARHLAAHYAEPMRRFAGELEWNARH